MNQICLHAFISGHVQGVFYRQSTRTKALELELTGWVRNLEDGRVETIACGSVEKVVIFEQWLWQGPAAAHVTKVSSEQLPWQLFTDFVVRKD